MLAQTKPAFRKQENLQAYYFSAADKAHRRKINPNFHWQKMKFPPATVAIAVYLTISRNSGR